MMTKDLKIFENDEFGKIRVVMIDGEPWFVAQDISNALDYSETSIMLRRLDDDEKVDRPLWSINENRYRNQKVISESGLYEAIFSSRKAKAKQFKKWVKTEVLPDIRKYGFHGTEDFVEFAVNNPDVAISLLQKYKFEKQQKELAEKQRDEAIATKAWIGSRREATAMSTASKYSRENDKLKTEIGNSKTWKQVKAIDWLGDMFNLKIKSAYSQIGRQLSKLSLNRNYPCKYIEDTQYGQVKAYHVDIISHFKQKLIDDLNMMRKYRVYG